MNKDYLDQAVVEPLKQVAREVGTIYLFALMGIVVGVVSTAILIGNKVFPTNDQS